MLSYLQLGEEFFGPLRLFQFISVRAILAGITALLFGFFLGPKLITLLRDFGAKQAFRDRDEVGELANLHEGKAKTPTMGGFLIFGSVIFSTLLWADPNIYVITAMLVYAVLTIVGFLDDFLKISKKNSKGLAGRYKLIGQLIATGLALFLLLGPLGDILTGVHGRAVGSTEKMMELWVPFYSDVLILSMPLVLVIGLFLLTLTGSSNAINLTDGLDGLAIGCTVTVALTYGIMSYASGNFVISEYLKISWIPGTGELTVVCAALLGGKFSLLMVQCTSSRDFYGRYRIPGDRRVSGHNSLNDSSTINLGYCWRNFCYGSGFCNFTSSFIQESGKKNFFNVSDSSPFRVERMERNKSGYSLLDFISLFAIIGLATLKLR